MRVGIYYAPESDDPLWTRGCAWLGRDPERGVACAQPALPDLPAITADARRYGFHATLKPPMALATSYAALRADAQRLAARQAPVTLPALRIADLHGFLALREAQRCPALHMLCDACVAGLDHHREPPSAAEIARRKPGDLSPAQRLLLQDWGYPYVFAEWRFHMTLTRRLVEAEKSVLLPALAEHFGTLLERPRIIASIALYVESEPGAPFTLAERLPLRG